jgi:hypothetical protein
MIIIISALFCQFLNAQVVNIEKKRKDDKEGFSGVLSLGFFFIDNGKKISQLRNVIDLQYDHGPNTIILLNDLDLIRVDAENLVNGGFQHLRYNYTIKDSSSFTLEAFFQHQYNPIKLLNRRLLVGGGPRFRMIDTEKTRCYLGTLVMLEFEELSDSLFTKNRIARLDAYISFNWDILNNLKFNNITYYQPAFQNPADFRLSVESNLELKITNALSFKIGIQANYDAKPPENIQKLFYNWQNELIYSF